MRQKSEEGQWVRKGHGKCSRNVSHACHHGVKASQRGVEAEHDEVSHIPAPDAVPCEETVVVMPLGDSGTQSTEVGAGQS